MPSLDQTLFLWINLGANAPSGLVWLARVISQWLPTLALSGWLAALLLGPARWRRALLVMGLAMALAWLGAHLVKDLVQVPRPYRLGLGKLWLPHAGGSGFPSSHTSVAMALAVAAWRAPWPLAVRIGLLTLGPLMAWSRVAVGVHFAYDVLAAMLLGTLCAWLAWVAMTRLATRPRYAPVAAVSPPDRF